jgi:hypothetical protein
MLASSWPHEGTDAHGGDGEPEGPRSIPDPVRTPRLYQQSLPPIRRPCRAILHCSNLRRYDSEVQ